MVNGNGNRQAPPTWTEERLQAPVKIDTTAIGMVLLHGCLVLAKTHPNIDDQQIVHIDGILGVFEEVLEELGLEPPEEGWRGGEEPPGPKLWVPD